MGSRRDYLGGLAAGWVGGLTGCTSLGEARNQVEMDNNTGDDVEALVEVTDDAGETLFRRSFAIDAGDQDEGAEWFEGEPARISVTVGEAEPLVGDWVSRVVVIRAGQRPESLGESPCVSGGDSMTGVFVRIESSEEVWLSPTCGDPT